MVSLRRRVATAAVALATSTTVVATPGGVPAGAASPTDRCYTAALHQVFLDRPASVYDLQAWTDRYEPAPARDALPRALALSDAWLEAVVVGIYDEALDRAPDAGGLTFWVDRLRGGTRVATLTAQVYGSDEVWARVGRTAEGFATDVFARIMGRSPRPADVTYWAGEVPRRGRGGVARALIGSIENRRARVTALYHEVLGRAPDTAGRDYWAGRLAALDDVDLAVHLASSAEAYQRAQVGCAVPPEPTTTRVTMGTSGPSRTPQISDDGRWIAFVSSARNLVPGDDADDVTDLFLHDRTTGSTTKVTDAGHTVRDVAISADGRHVTFAAAGVEPADGGPGFDIFSWDRDTGTFTRVTDTDLDSREPSPSADGRHITFTSRAALTADDDDAHDDVYLWDRVTGTTVLVSQDVDSASAAHISAGGDRIVYQSIDGNTLALVSWDRATGVATPVAEGYHFPFAITDDGDVLHRYYAGAGRYQLLLWEAATGTVTPVFEGDNEVTGADLAADGATVAFSTFANGLFPGDTHDSPDVFVWERATGTIAHIGQAGVSGSSPTTSADGRLVAHHATDRRLFGFAQIAVWDRGS